MQKLSQIPVLAWAVVDVDTDDWADNNDELTDVFERLVGSDMVRYRAAPGGGGGGQEPRPSRPWFGQKMWFSK